MVEAPFKKITLYKGLIFCLSATPDGLGIKMF